MRDVAGKYMIIDDRITGTVHFDKSGIYDDEIYYEVIAFFNGHFLYLEEHLERLSNSARLGNVHLWPDMATIKEKIEKLPELNSITDGSITIAFIPGYKSEFIAYINASDYPTEENFLKGVDTKLIFAEREAPHRKTYRTKIKNEAKRLVEEHGIYEVILVNRDGYITEGSRSNIFFIQNENLFTAPVEDILPGVTRKRILELCNYMDIKVIFKKIHYGDINEYESSFLTGTTTRVLPVRSIDDTMFHVSHPIIRRIMLAYREEIMKQTGGDI